MNPRLWSERLLARLSPELRSALGQSPLKALGEVIGLRVVATGAMNSWRDGGGWCDGLSFTAAGELLYVPTPYSKRQNFTLLHELGHFLIDQEDDEAVLVWSADQPRWRIEQTCDLVAASLLLPNEELGNSFAGGRPTGRSLADLAESRNASREVCAISLSQRIGCGGFAVLVHDDKVTFASRSGDVRPVPWRGDAVPAAHPFRSLENGQERQSETFWTSGKGERQRFYASMFRVERWRYGIFAEHDLWGIAKLHLPNASDSPKTALGRHIACRCGYRGWAPGYPHSVCHSMECPECGKCQCDWKESSESRGRCRECTTVVRSHLLVDGLCDRCQ